MNKFGQDWIPLILGMTITLLSILSLTQHPSEPSLELQHWENMSLSYFNAGGILLEGLGLIFLTRSRLITGIFGIIIITLGLSGILIFNLGILFNDGVLINTSLNSNNYLSSSAICFALVGLVYLIISFYGYAKKYIIIANIILCITTSLSFLSFFNSLSNTPSQNIWLQIPNLSGISFILIAITCFILLWHNHNLGKQRGSTVNAIIFGIACFTLFSIFSLSFKNANLKQSKQTAHLQSHILINTLSANIEDQIEDLFRFMNSIGQKSNINQNQRTQQYQRLITEKPFIESIIIHTNHNQIITINNPQKNKLHTPELEVRANLPLESEFNLALISNDTAIISNSDDDQFIINLPELIKSIWSKQYYIEPVEIEIEKNGQPIYSTIKSSDLKSYDIITVNDTFKLFNVNFNILLKMHTRFFEQDKPNFSMVFFVFGFFISLLFVLLVRAREISNYRLKSLYKSISILRKTKNNLRKMARIDHLTGIANRTAMMAQIETEINKAERNKTKLAVMFIDIDNFKHINDTYGHNCGDLILKQVTSRLKATIRKSDYIARFAGDEFIVLAPDLNELEGIEILASRCIKAFIEPFGCHNTVIKISPSIGISSYPVCGQTADELIKNADIAMYKAKQQGKNNFKIFNDDINQRLLRQHNLKVALEKALDRNEFTLAYQPIIDVAKNKVIGIEALLRWNNEDIYSPSPNEFIPLSETSRLINPIGDWIIEKALSDFESIKSRSKHHQDIFLSINISHVQLMDEHAFNKLYEKIKLFENTQIPLVFEIKENVVMQNIDIIKQRMATLRKCNVEFALDNFAEFATSIVGISELPVKYIKINQNLITQINHSQQANKTIKGILALINQLDIVAIAKGVETGEQLDFLKKQACLHLQGYSFSKPLHLSKLIAYLKLSN